MTGLLEGKRVLVTGGTGSLGQALVRRLLEGDLGRPAKVIVFSRDEAKQHAMRLAYLRAPAATDEVIYQNFQELLEFRIGDVRVYESIASALRSSDVVVNSAAMKQVPNCEYFPFEAVMTNIGGAENIVRAIRELTLPIELVVGVSTDKACKPVNAMGMTKALQERVFTEGNIRCPDTRFVCVRYGNVLASRGSVIPLFLAQIAAGGPVTITTPDMTRFLLTLDEAVKTIFAAMGHARRGEVYVPRLRSANVVDLARYLIGDRRIELLYTGIRPGEKVHESLVSDEESHRAVGGAEGHFAIRPLLPELLTDDVGERALEKEFTSADTVMGPDALAAFLRERLEAEMAQPVVSDAPR